MVYEVRSVMKNQDNLDNVEDNAEVVMLGQLEFEGPFESEGAFKEDAGIVAVFHATGEDAEMVNLYETANVKLSARQELNKTHEEEHIYLAAHYNGSVPSKERCDRLNALWAEFNAA